MGRSKMGMKVRIEKTMVWMGKTDGWQVLRWFINSSTLKGKRQIYENGTRAKIVFI